VLNYKKIYILLKKVYLHNKLEKLNLLLYKLNQKCIYLMVFKQVFLNLGSQDLKFVQMLL
jgi:hypothetical protein